MPRREAKQEIFPSLAELDAALYGPVLRFILFFPPERPFISGNHHNRLGRPRRSKRGKLISTTYTPAAAKEQAEYIASVASAAAWSEQWKMPDYVRMDMLGINIDADRENLHKVCADPLEGVVFFNDRRVKTGDITILRAKGPPRIVVAIQAINGKALGFAKPSSRRDSAGAHVPLRSTRSNSGKIRASRSESH